MNIQVLLDIMSDRAAYHASVAENMPCRSWMSALDMNHAVAANSNTENPAVKQAELFKNNRNEMLYDYVPSEMAAKPSAIKTHLFTASTRAMITMSPVQSFVSNCSTLGQENVPEAKPVQNYWYEDMPMEAVLEDVTPTNVIQFVPRNRVRQNRRHSK